MIEFRHVCKSYDKEIQTINDLSFKIEEGEFVFIVGASGSGKTTLFKLLLKEIEATSGSIIVGGADIGRMKRDKNGEVLAMQCGLPILIIKEGTN